MEPPPDAGPPGRWAQVAVGDSHVCALDVEGTLYCWGSNANGQLGLGAGIEVQTPTRVGEAVWAEVSTRGATTCAIAASDRGLWCWGANTNGQVGNGGTMDVFEPVAIGGAWSHVSAGGMHTCAIRDSGAMACWGLNATGQLGAGDLLPSEIPRDVMSTESWLQVATGDNTTCALAADQRAWCWGSGAYGELGIGRLANRSVPTLLGPRTWESITVGAQHVCAVRTDSVIACWGSNLRGQLGEPLVSYSEVPNPLLDSEPGYRLVAAGSEHTCAARTDGTLSCWGSNSDGQTGPGAVSQYGPVPRPIELAGSEWLQIAGGSRATCAITADHHLWCWGADVGPAAMTTTTLPAQVAGTWKRVVASDYSSCGITSDGALACWGYNARGTVGDGSRITRYAPVTIAPGAWNDVSVANTHACALDAEGAAWCWGNNAGGLGDGSFLRTEPTLITTRSFTSISTGFPTLAIEAGTGHLWCWGGALAYCGVAAGDASMPLQVGTDTWTTIGTGSSHACGTSSTGVQCWGDNYYGGLGDGTYAARYTPGPIAATTGLTSGTFDGGSYFTCGLSAPNLWCWGANFYGEHGGATAAQYSALPGQVPGAWRSFAAGANHVCAVAMDGALWCWGSNGRGQLGDGTLVSTTGVRIQVGTETDWDQVSAGAGHTCAIKTDASLWCWGSNQYGQLGIGSSEQVGVPRVVP